MTASLPSSYSQYRSSAAAPRRQHSRPQMSNDELRRRAIALIEQVNREALPALGGLLQQWFKNGRIEGRGHGAEFIVGSIDDDPGGSFRINLGKGIGRDFNGEGKGFSGVVSIYAAKHRIKPYHAARELAAALGISLEGHPPLVPTAHRSCPVIDRSRLAVASVPAVAPEIWRPVMPIPVSAGRLMRPDRKTVPIYNQKKEPGKRWSRWRPTRVWDYRNAAGEIVGFVIRLDFPDGSKITPQVTYCEGPNGERRWCNHPFSQPRPLYRLEALARRPDADVIIPEGEKAADAAARLCPDHVAMAWPGGCNGVPYVDWTPLKGRRVYIMRDADSPGVTATHKIIEQLRGVGAEALVVEPPADSSTGWDIADGERDGWTREDAAAYLAGAISPEAFVALHPLPDPAAPHPGPNVPVRPEMRGGEGTPIEQAPGAAIDPPPVAPDSLGGDKPAAPAIDDAAGAEHEPFSNPLAMSPIFPRPPIQDETEGMAAWLKDGPNSGVLPDGFGDNSCGGSTASDCAAPDMGTALPTVFR
jgi:hypothetical protein